MPVPPGFFSLKAKNPRGLPLLEFLLPQNKIDSLASGAAPAAKFFESFSVPEALLKPGAIFKGLKREEMDGGLCYSAKPRKYRNEKIEEPPPRGFIFLVFVDGTQKVFNWRWEKEDQTLADHPKDWETRFDEKLWPN